MEVVCAYASRFKKDLGVEVVHSFVARLRDVLDEICCNTKDEERFYTSVQIDSLIDTYLANIKERHYENEGEIVSDRKAPKSLVEKVKKEIGSMPSPILKVSVVEDFKNKDGKSI